MHRSIDLNADIGEHLHGGLDNELLQIVTSANISCGVHAGNRDVTRKTILRAKSAGVSIGAHPGMPGQFGRSTERIDPHKAFHEIRNQLLLFQSISADCAANVSYVKVHGALYNQAEVDLDLADVIVQVVREVNSSLRIIGLANGQLIRHAQKNGLVVAGEFFADRTYLPNGHLTPRSQEGSVIDDVDGVVRRCVYAIKEGVILAVDGTPVQISFDTICLHGDTKTAFDFALKIKETLIKSSILVRPIDWIHR